jgi:hypothetical protein
MTYPSAEYIADVQKRGTIGAEGNPPISDDVDVFITPKIKQWLVETATKYNVRQEGLASVLLVLGLSDERTLDQALSLLRAYELGGATDMANKGW